MSEKPGLRQRLEAVEGYVFDAVDPYIDKDELTLREKLKLVDVLNHAVQMLLDVQRDILVPDILEETT